MNEKNDLKNISAVSWPETIDLAIYSKETRFPLADFDVLDALKEGLPENSYPETEIALDVCLPFSQRVKSAIEIIKKDKVFLNAFYQTDREVEFNLDVDRRIKIAEIFSAHGIEVKKDPDLLELGFENIKAIENVLFSLDINDLFELLVQYNREIEMDSVEDYDLVWIERSRPDRASNFKTIAGKHAYLFFQDLIDDKSGQFGIGHIIRYVYFHRTEFSFVDQRFSLSIIDQN